MIGRRHPPTEFIIGRLWPRTTLVAGAACESTADGDDGLDFDAEFQTFDLLVGATYSF